MSKSKSNSKFSYNLKVKEVIFISEYKSIDKRLGKIKIISGDAGGSIRFWDFERGTPEKILLNFSSRICNIKSCYEKNLLLSGSYDLNYILWNFGKGQSGVCLPRKKLNRIHSAVFTKGCEYLILSTDEGLEAWDASDIKLVGSTSVEGYIGPSMIILEDNILLMPFTNEEKNKSGVHLLKIPSFEYVDSILNDTNIEYFYSAKFWKTENIVFLGTFSGKVKTLDLNRNRFLSEYRIFDNSGVLLEFSLERNKLFITNLDSKDVYVLEPYSMRLLSVLQEHNDVITDICISPCGRYLLSASMDKTIIIWDLETEKKVKKLTGHAFGVTAISVLKKDVDNFL